MRSRSDHTRSSEPPCTVAATSASPRPTRAAKNERARPTRTHRRSAQWCAGSRSRGGGARASRGRAGCSRGSSRARAGCARSSGTGVAAAGRAASCSRASRRRSLRTGARAGRGAFMCSFSVATIPRVGKRPRLPTKATRRKHAHTPTRPARTRLPLRAADHGRARSARPALGAPDPLGAACGPTLVSRAARSLR